MRFARKGTFNKEPITSQPSKSIYYVAMLTFGVVLLFLFYVAYELFAPIKALTLEQPLKVITKKVTSGSDFIYEAKYCRYIDGPSYVYRTFVSVEGETFYPLAPVTSVAKIGCGTAIIHILIPDGFTPGKYKMQAIAELHPSNIRTVKVPFETEVFEVVDK